MTTDRPIHWWGRLGASADLPPCDRCDEPVEDQWCTHGRDLCPECLWVCSDCQDERAEVAG